MSARVYGMAVVVIGLLVLILAWSTFITMKRLKQAEWDICTGSHVDAAEQALERGDLTMSQRELQAMLDCGDPP